MVARAMSEICVALVEDHDLTRMGLRTALQSQDGIRVIGEAANATQGLKLLQTTKPDVAIVDIGLPDMDGMELTKLFRKFQVETGDAATKILILTMQDSEDAVLAAFTAGADSYCMKNIGIDKLTEALRSTAAGSAWIDPAIANVVLRQVRRNPSEQEMEFKKTNIGMSASDSEYGQVLESYPLTERELEVLELIVAGCSNAVIAEKLYITVGTVKTHVRNILNKLCADDRTQAAVRALRFGLVA